MTAVRPMTTTIPGTFHKTRLGEIVHGDSLDVMAGLAVDSVDLITMSPPADGGMRRPGGDAEAGETPAFPGTAGGYADAERRHRR